MFAACVDSGIDHRIETHALGARNLAESARHRLAAAGAGLGGGSASEVDVAELHAPFAHQELILCEALGIDPSAGRVAVNPSGGALAANAMMVAGLIRIGEAASRGYRRFCTSGPGTCDIGAVSATEFDMCSLADEPGPLGAPERSARDEV